MATPRFTEQQKLDVGILCLRHRHYGRVSPSDDQIRRELKLRSTDDVLSLLAEMVREGRIEIRRDQGLTREVDILPRPSWPVAPALTGAVLPAAVAAPLPDQAAEPLAGLPPIKPANVNVRRRHEDQYCVQLKMNRAEQAELRQAADLADCTLGEYVAGLIRDAGSTQRAPGGKPFLRAHVVRAANASPLGFWPYVNHLIEAGSAIEQDMQP